MLSFQDFVTQSAKAFNWNLICKDFSAQSFRFYEFVNSSYCGSYDSNGWMVRNGSKIGRGETLEGAIANVLD